jgi:hypothetical protein
MYRLVWENYLFLLRQFLLILINGGRVIMSAAADCVEKLFAALRTHNDRSRCLIQAPDRISGRPPRGGLSVCERAGRAHLGAFDQ